MRGVEWRLVKAAWLEAVLDKDAPAALTASALSLRGVRMMSDIEREEFEQWAKESGYALLKTGLNDYFYKDTGAAWDAWQAVLSRGINKYGPQQHVQNIHGSNE